MGRASNTFEIEGVPLRDHVFATKVRVTGYLLWDDEHNGSADVGSTIEYLSKNGFHHPWRSTAWEIHPVMKIEIVE